MTVEDEILCIGETMAVVSPMQNTSLESADQCLLGIGGAESNVALQLAELGVASRWAGRIGDDPFGRRIVGALASHGVDVSLVDVDPEAPTGVYFKEPDLGSGARTLYYRSGSAASRIGAEAVGTWGLAAAHHVHVSGISAAISASSLDFLEAVLDTRAAALGTTSFDVNFRPALWPASEAGPVLRRLAARAEVVLVGLDEANTLWGCETSDDVARLLPEPRHVVVKDGGVEAVEYLRPEGASEQRHAVPAGAVRIVEPVGAGDAFAAGFLAGLIRGASPRERLSLGHRLAAWTLGAYADVRPGHGLSAPAPVRHAKDQPDEPLR